MKRGYGHKEMPRWVTLTPGVAVYATEKLLHYPPLNEKIDSRKIKRNLSCKSTTRATWIILGPYFLIKYLLETLPSMFSFFCFAGDMWLLYFLMIAALSD